MTRSEKLRPQHNLLEKLVNKGSTLARTLQYSAEHLINNRNGRRAGSLGFQILFLGVAARKTGNITGLTPRITIVKLFCKDVGATTHQLSRYMKMALPFGVN
jgi:hypothetical protein